MAASTQLMTFAEFSKLPEDQGLVYYELRHGELVAVTRPKLKHQLIQGRMRDFLRKVIPVGSYVETEVSFRALPEHEFRVADVGYVSAERWRNVDLDDYIRGAPDVVIEVLSPSNTAVEMIDREKLCLETGAKEFWVIDPVRKLIRVSTSDGHTRTYESGQQIPLPLFGSHTLPVDAVFTDPPPET